MSKLEHNGVSSAPLDLHAAIDNCLANPAKLRTELEGTRSVIIQHAIGMLNQIGLSGAEADEIVKRGA